MQEVLDLVRGNIVIFLIACLLLVFAMSRVRRLVDPLFALIALALFLAFIGFMVVRLGEIDLTIVAVGVAIMVVVDFVSTIREGSSNGDGSEGA